MKDRLDLSQLYRHAKSLSDEIGGDANPSAKAHHRSIFISDVHLGKKDCKAAELVSFLKYNQCERLYLVGDIFDGWRMNSGVYWNKHFNRVIRYILKLSKMGIPVYYITGNHDEFLRRFANNDFDNIHLVNRATHTSATGKRYLVIHGDQFEGVTHCSAILKYIGDVGYEFLMMVNRVFNRIRSKAGYGFWSFAAFLKNHVNRAKRYIHDYEQAVAKGAKKQGFDGVICGHIHHAAAKSIHGLDYFNTGDWVESCTALVENHQGEFSLIYWLESPRYREKLARKKAKSTARLKQKLRDRNAIEAEAID